MAKSKNAEEKLLGVPLTQFGAAVDAVAELRDTGKALVFVDSIGGVRFVGLSSSVAEFHQQLSNRLQGTIPDTTQLRQTLAEIEDTVSVILSTEDVTQAAKRVLFIKLDEFRHESQFNLDNPAHEQTYKKVQAAMRLATDTLRHRLLRLRSATIPCPEELDAELVRERQDKYMGKRVEAPFLRLRFRFRGDRGVDLMDFPLFYRRSLPLRSFEFECDLSDLDLLQQRLDEARKILLDASTVKESRHDRD